MKDTTTFWKTALATALCAAICSPLALAQVAPPSILQIDVANNVIYLEDTGDTSKFATAPNVPTLVGHGTNNFNRGSGIGDIVAVNGQPVTGTHLRSAANFFLAKAPVPGQAIADTGRVAVAIFTFEILKSDGTPIGTIMTEGLAGGPGPPGAPLTATGGNNFVITGGTGAFLGARGKWREWQIRREWLPNGQPPLQRTPRTAASMEAERNGM